MDPSKCAVCSLAPCSPWETGRRPKEKEGARKALTVSGGKGALIQEPFEHATHLIEGYNEVLLRA